MPRSRKFVYVLRISNNAKEYCCEYDLVYMWSKLKKWSVAGATWILSTICSIKPVHFAKAAFTMRMFCAIRKLGLASHTSQPEAVCDLQAFLPEQPPVLTDPQMKISLRDTDVLAIARPNPFWLPARTLAKKFRIPA